MTMIRGVLVLSSLLAFVASAVDFGNSVEIKAAHPEFFAPAHVSVVTNGGEVYYVYSGRARRMPNKAIPPVFPQLQSIAQLRAEDNLSKYLLKNRPKRIVTLRGSRQIAKEVGDDWVTYVFAVPIANVTIQSLPAPVVSVHSNHVERSNPPGKSQISERAGVDENSSENLLSLLDQVEQNPNDGILKAKLAQAYFDRSMYDEAVEEARSAQAMLLSGIRTNVPAAKALLMSSSVLMKCGEYRKARDGYRAVQRLNQAEYRSEVLQALSQIQLEIGME